MAEPDWKTELREIVKAIAGRSPYLEQYAFDRLAEQVEAAYQRGLMAGKSQQGYATRRKASLSKRQLDVARLAAAGMTNKEIAKALYITVNSVQTHMRYALKKTGARTRAQLGALLAMNGDITDSDVSPKEGSCTAGAAGSTPASSTEPEAT